MSSTPTRPRALITGASSGIGEGFAQQLAQQGYDLVLVARRLDRLEQLAAALAAERGINTEVVQADLVTDGGIAPIETRLRQGDIDLLVNNAGFGTFGEFASLPLDRELEELDLNVRAMMRLCHAALNGMTPRRSGAIINVASAAAFQPVPYNATYAATKAFVLHFSEGIHEEAKEHGVTVTCLCPGPVRTEFQQVGGITDSFMPAFAWESVESVVRSALSALRGKHAVAVPGTVNFMTVTGSRFTPHFLTRRIAGAMFRREVMKDN